MEYRTTCLSPLGTLTLASDGKHLTGLWLEGQRYFGGRATLWTPRDDLPVFDMARTWLAAYFDGKHPDAAALPLAPQGTDFQRRVWQQLLTIPYGRTVTYGALASAVSCASARAVGGAVGRNPISVIIPCHRVVGAGSQPTGYAGGIERKMWLLTHEGCEIGKDNLSRQQ